MKKILLLLFILAFADLAYGQASSLKSRFNFGISGGLNLAGTYKLHESQSNMSGGFVGFDLYYQLLKATPSLKLHFQPNWNTSTYDNKRTNQWDRDYVTGVRESIELPFTLRFEPFRKSKIGLFIEGGLGYQYRYKDKAQIDADVNCIMAPCPSYRIDVNINQISHAETTVLTGAVGAELNLGKIRIPLCVRVQEGLGTYVIKDSENNAYNRNKYAGLKTRNIQISTGIIF